MQYNARNMSLKGSGWFKDGKRIDFMKEHHSFKYFRTDNIFIKLRERVLKDQVKEFQETFNQPIPRNIIIDGEDYFANTERNEYRKTFMKSLEIHKKINFEWLLSNKFIDV